MSNKVHNIKNLIRSNKKGTYLKNYERIKDGKSFDIYFNNYTEKYVKEMIDYFESVGEYKKSSYLNLKLNGFKNK